MGDAGQGDFFYGEDYVGDVTIGDDHTADTSMYAARLRAARKGARLVGLLPRPLSNGRFQETVGSGQCGPRMR